MVNPIFSAPKAREVPDDEYIDDDTGDNEELPIGPIAENLTAESAVENTAEGSVEKDKPMIEQVGSTDLVSTKRESPLIEDDMEEVEEDSIKEDVDPEEEILGKDLNEVKQERMDLSFCKPNSMILGDGLRESSAGKGDVSDSDEPGDELESALVKDVGESALKTVSSFIKDEEILTVTSASVGKRTDETLVCSESQVPDVKFELKDDELKLDFSLSNAGGKSSKTGEDDTECQTAKSGENKYVEENAEVS